MSTLKFKNHVLKRYYIFEWNREDSVLQKVSLQRYMHVLCKHTYRCPTELLKRSLKSTRRLYAKILRDNI